MHWSDLEVWKKAHSLVKEIYKNTISFPREELYGLTSQIRRAVVSVPTNIVEGFSKNSTKEYIQLLFIARGSLEEVRYLLLLSKELEFVSKVMFDNIEGRCEKVSKMLNALINSLRNKIK